MQSTYMSGFRKLRVWQDAHALTLKIYQTTARFPVAEQFGLTDQMRRASSSIEAQIAEGSRMATMKHRKLYYNRAYASAAELDGFLELVRDLAYIDQKEYEEILNWVNRIAAQVYKLSLSCSIKK